MPGSPDQATDPVAARIAELDALRKRVMAVVGHELRTPVTTLRGLADALGHADPAVIRAEIAPALARLAHRVEALLDDLLVAADLGTVLPVGRPRPVDVAQAVHAAWSDGTRDPSRLRLDGPEGVRAVVPPASLPRMLAPVLDNAAKYGTGDVTVRFGPTGDGRVEIAVACDGPPVSSIDVALAFEPFYRGEHAVTSAPGLGVGLPVCRALVEHAGGTVELSARPEGGVVVTLVLPGQ